MEWCINYDKKIVFITINRNAGTTLREFLPKCGFEVVEKPFIDKVIDYSFFAIIRDPVDRWISGVNEYICYNDKEVSESKQFVKSELSNNNFYFDQHTRPQYKSLTMIEECNLIKLDDNFIAQTSFIFNSSYLLPTIIKPPFDVCFTVIALSLYAPPIILSVPETPILLTVFI